MVPYALDHFGPDALVVQCGADAHFRDPLADLLLTSQVYERLFRRLLDLADEHTGGRILCTLGGGYHLDAVARVWTMLALVVRDIPLPESIPESWRNRWQDQITDPLSKTLHDPEQSFSIARRSSIEEENRQTSKQVLEMLAPHWY